jgi:hypothetical protein
VDLDNDGDLDLVVNNINDEASVLKNTTNDNAKDKKNNYLQVAFEGDSLNIAGIGATIQIRYDHGKQQVWEHTPFRGYLSSNQDIAHFGLGGVSVIDILLVQWPNGKMQQLRDVSVNQLLKLKMKDATETICAATYFTCR